LFSSREPVLDKQTDRTEILTKPVMRLTDQLYKKPKQNKNKKKSSTCDCMVLP